MKHLMLICCLSLPVVACDSGPERRSPLPQPSPVVPSAPEPPPPPSPPPAPPLPAGTQVIGVGEEVKGVTSGADRNYAITVPAEGTLIVHLKWAETAGSYTLRLKVNGKEIPWQCGEFAPWPVEGRAQVVAGEQVWIAVGMGPGCWDYARAGPLETSGAEFVVTSSME
jgi:hypothetical protein